MPDPTPEFTWTPDWGAQRKTTPRVTVLSFGENYAQRIGRGINRVPKVLPLTFSNRTDVEADAIEAFFEARGGATSFTYSHKAGPIKRYVTLGEWTRTDAEFNRNTVQVTFQEVP